MPVVLSFIDRATGETIIDRDLIQVDARLCAALGVEPDANLFYRGWVDRVGFSLALGATFDQCRETFAKSADMLPVIDWLEVCYENNSFREIGRR